MKIIGCFLNYFFWLYLAVFSAGGTAELPSPKDSAADEYQTLEWPDLIPPKILEILMNPPSYLDDIEDGSAEDLIGSGLKGSEPSDTEDAYQQALVSTEINSELNGAMVRIPGFIVPLEFDDEQTVTQFFLVPYFGACLHMPPPPPNQIILVNSPQGVQLSALYDPFWVKGELRTTFQENDMATSAYSMAMLALEPYTY